MPAQAFVGSDDGERFDAHVELEEPGPTSWRRDDVETVAAGMLRELRRDARVGGAHSTGLGRHVQLTFALRCGGELEAQAHASEILRAAWSRLRITAVPGRDYDVSIIEVAPAQPT